MLRAESKWIADVISEMPHNSIFPILNVGSSTCYFRSVVQPWIENEIFLPLKKKGLRVYHTDVKSGEGVNFVGNLLDKEFIIELSKIQIKSILCSSLLEHIEITQLPQLCHNLISLLRKGGYLIVTVPFKYMWHPDPIDNMFRPNINELAGLFPGTEIQKAEIKRCEYYYDRFLHKPYKLIRLVIRLLLPFYNYEGWLQQVNALKYFFTPFEVTCIVLQKIDD